MTLGSGCPCDRRGTEDSGAKWGHLGKVDVLLLLGFSGILQDEVQLLTWLQDDVNLPNFCSGLLHSPSIFLCLLVLFTYEMEITPLPCALEFLEELVE